eukprot:2888835-Rhodomonas_salina.3
MNARRRTVRFESTMSRSCCIPRFPTSAPRLGQHRPASCSFSQSARHSWLEHAKRMMMKKVMMGRRRSWRMPRKKKQQQTQQHTNTQTHKHTHTNSVTADKKTKKKRRPEQTERENAEHQKAVRRRRGGAWRWRSSTLIPTYLSGDPSSIPPEHE